MSIQADTNPSDLSAQHRRVKLQRLRTIVNIVLLFIVLRDGNIIRNDGSNGFAEVAFKGAVIYLSIAFLFINYIAKKHAACRGKIKPPLTAGDVITTLWLAFFASICIIDACSDGKGYCRHWNIFGS